MDILTALKTVFSLDPMVFEFSHNPDIIQLDPLGVNVKKFNDNYASQLSNIIKYAHTLQELEEKGIKVQPIHLQKEKDIYVEGPGKLLLATPYDEIVFRLEKEHIYNISHEFDMNERDQFKGLSLPSGETGLGDFHYGEAAAKGHQKKAVLILNEARYWTLEGEISDESKNFPESNYADAQVEYFMKIRKKVLERDSYAIQILSPASIPNSTTLISGASQENKSELARIVAELYKTKGAPHS